MEGKPHGRGVMVYPDGRVANGDWYESSLTELLLFPMPFMNAIFFCFLSFSTKRAKGALHGQATVFYKDNSSYFGTFSLSKRVGYGMRTYTDGSKYVGPYFDDKPNGKGVLTNQDGSSLHGDFQDGKLDGFVTKISSDGEAL